ncbi:MAG: ATP-binding cassette domain-containing protein [Parcubacteria group bacterium]|nr:ATP-binding cassette domain-containing protein [Parcubacteria group bacterium]
MKPIIKFENVSVGYSLGKSNEVWVLKDITGEIYPEEYIVFFGPSGCGKSTLLYTISFGSIKV